MKTVTIIKKSSNVWAWSNQNLGETIKVTENKDHPGKWYVRFSENKNLKGINEKAVAGTVDKEDCILT